MTFLPQREFFLTYFDIQKTDGKFHKLWGQISRHYGFYTQIGYLCLGSTCYKHTKKVISDSFAFEAGSLKTKNNLAL